MAKRLIDWTVSDKGALNLNEYNSDKDAKVVELESFDLTKIFPDFVAMNEVQKHFTVYGMKQVLADAGASVKDAAGKAEKAKAKFQLALDGKLHGPRANGTAKAEDKKLVDSVKTAAKVISLEGLMAKKMYFADTFTDEDQVKLSEFWAVEIAGTQKAPKVEKPKADKTK